MKRNSFSTPLVFLTAVNPNDVGGHGSGTSDPEGIRPIPLSFEEWLQSRWVGDYDNDPGVDFKDYAKWFAANGFGTSMWDSINPGVVNDNETK